MQNININNDQQVGGGVRKTATFAARTILVNRCRHRHFEPIDVDRLAVTQRYRPIGERRIYSRLTLKPDESVVAGPVTAPIDTAHDTCVNHSTVLGERVA